MTTSCQSFTRDTSVDGVRVGYGRGFAVAFSNLLPSSSPLGTGAGIGPTIQIGEQTAIAVDAKAAGKGKVTCTVCTPEDTEVDIDVVENLDRTFDIFYTAPQPGKYIVCVRFGGEHIPKSPFQVTVSTSCAISDNSTVLKTKCKGV